MKNPVVTVMILAAAITFTSSSFAASPTPQEPATKTIECSFTEPFFTLTVNLEDRTVSKTEPDFENGGGGTITTVIATDIEFPNVSTDPFLPEFIVTDGQSVILSLTMNFKGSDGMSDITFPLEGRYENMWGGCSTDKVKPVNPYEGQN